MDSVSSPAFGTPSPSHAAEPRPAPSAEFTAANHVASLPELCELAECTRVDLSAAEFGAALLAAGQRCHFNQPAEVVVTSANRESFFRGLRLADLALAHACALGREAAWQLFLDRFREPLLLAAIAITGSSSLGRDLAEALPSELFGLSLREGERRSPLLSYSGRGSLLGWLRATLAQRHVDRHRRTHRETPLESMDVAAAPADATPATETVAQLQRALATTLRSLTPEDAFVLSAWFLDGRTLLQIARLLRVSEATVSRRVKRLNSDLRARLLSTLVAQGLSRRAAEEALGTDPRDLTFNLRALLQNRASTAFQGETTSLPASR